jgi:SAM-dependent methyltransferase
MEAAEYRKMAAVEDAMWWYRALRANLIALLGREMAAPRALVLDAGCGTGGLLAGLRQAGIAAVGLELDSGAARLARGKSGCPVVVGSIAALPFADQSFDAVVSADVLCHGGVDETDSLAEMRRCLKSGGALLLNLPAYGWMLSEHDRAVNNVRRYTRGGLARMLAAAGFAEISGTYWNTLLWPLMVARRKLLPAGSGGSDVRPFPGPVDRLFRWLAGLETGWLRCGWSLPFGGSVLVKAVKHG